MSASSPRNPEMSRNEFPDVKGIDTANSVVEKTYDVFSRNEFPDVKGIDTSKKLLLPILQE